jgi:hypothetical protein
MILRKRQHTGDGTIRQPFAVHFQNAADNFLLPFVIHHDIVYASLAER